MNSWRYIRDNDYPKEEGRYWCVSAFKSYTGEVTYYTTDLEYCNNLHNSCPYIEKEGKGFMDQDPCSGEVYEVDVVCWTKLPEIPKEFRKRR